MRLILYDLGGGGSASSSGMFDVCMVWSSFFVRDMLHNMFCNISGSQFLCVAHFLLIIRVLAHVGSCWWSLPLARMVA